MPPSDFLVKFYNRNFPDKSTPVYSLSVFYKLLKEINHKNKEKLGGERN